MFQSSCFKRVLKYKLSHFDLLIMHLITKLKIKCLNFLFLEIFRFSPNKFLPFKLLLNAFIFSPSKAVNLF